jgi:hypothetical protein
MLAAACGAAIILTREPRKRLQQDFEELLAWQLAYHVLEFQVKSGRQHFRRGQPGKLNQLVQVAWLVHAQKLIERSHD